MSQETEPPADSPPGSATEVFRVFLVLGLTSFGGPVAHLGYFRQELVERRRWLGDAAYGELAALCQSLPGPASSQLGFALGLARAGWPGALAAFIGFTLPSALLLLAFALTATALTGPLWAGAVHGLKIAAVAIVAQAVWGMGRRLCPDPQRAAIAVAAVAVLAVAPGPGGMVAAIVLGALAGLALGRGRSAPVAADIPAGVSKRAAVLALGLFAGLLVMLPLLAGEGQGIAVFDRFYRAGAWVFGGGHVVLPLLQAELVQPGWVATDTFLAGYGAAQAMPGPLFSFAAYLGAVLEPEPHGIAGAAIALAGLFLPGLLILVGLLPFWRQLRTRPGAQSLLQGTNAAVVGILGASLYSPVFTSAIFDLRDFALALGCLLLLTAWRAPPWLVVPVAALGGLGLALTG